MNRKLLPGLIMALFAAVPAFAFEPFVVKDIRVEGIQRTEAGTVFNYLPVRVGERFDEGQAAEAIRALFATGFFSDVRIETEGDVIVVVVDERPAIAQIDFVGVKEFDKDALKAGLREVGLAESRIFDRSLLERAEQELKRQYLSRGKYSAQIKTTVTPLERNRVGINFNVEEGDVAKIRQIAIVGAKAYDEDDLLEQMQLTTPGWLTWYTKNDQYSRQKLSADLETLRSFYLNQGYLDFNIDSTQVSITPDKQDIYITVNITEGEKYTVSGMRFTGDLVLPESEYLAMSQLRPGDTFSRERLTETTKAITDRLGNEGYAFANVNAAPEVDKEKRQVAFTVFVDPGRRVYVRRINIGGNTKSRDEVVRREMRQMEGGWYDAAAINRSRTRIDRLGFFDEVNVETPAVPGTTDQVDVNFTVKERPTGNLMLGAGFSSSESIVLSASIAQQNLFGSGNALTLALNTSKSNRTVSLSFTNPYYTVDGVSLGWDLYHRTYDSTDYNSLSPYKTVSTGAGLRLGWPIAEDDQINFGLTADQTKITTFDESPRLYQDFCNDNGGCSGTGVGDVSVSSLLLTVGWSRDSRDSFIYPRKGTYQRLYGEVTVPVGDLRYGKLGYQHQHWFPFGRDYALMLNADVGYAKGFGGKGVPFYKNYYVGGIGSVRGFDQGTLGPKFTDTDGDITSTGGTRKLVGNAEFYFPMPGAGTDRSFRISAFFDAGYVWGEDPDTGKEQKIGFDDLRYSTGLAFSWSSPIGPLKFSLGYPLKKEKDDEIQRFQFQLGSVF
ncbi:outer membrane protein assembly factor BamA [Thauera propionica]|uniref:Outer membrane protein assembly factor BamA n=1 Tax=Thauera propionica TaxID=2019431 RepID=A0A235F0T0_9RHOO|nr:MULTISPECIES: outer membrane protein assembly factor BamA [Thauera]MDD3674907.1 outer membrane protein assembly factor BamA [Thauera propionica]MDI3488817.1 outer membrane protein insertion porin family [Thauera sp.]OYD54633.1 outer membrane protein assembly factor BamA [Thauera propionica]